MDLGHRPRFLLPARQAKLSAFSDAEWPACPLILLPQFRVGAIHEARTVRNVQAVHRVSVRNKSIVCRCLCAVKWPLFDMGTKEAAGAALERRTPAEVTQPLASV